MKMDNDLITHIMAIMGWSILILMTVFCFGAMGSELELTYKDTQVQDSFTGSLLFRNNGKILEGNYDFIIKDIYTSDGNAFYGRYNYHHDIDHRFVFVFVSLNKDEVLGIDAIDYGFGGGIKVKRFDFLTEKYSAAIILRDSQLLTSIRYKIKLSMDKYSAIALAQLIMPENEFNAELSLNHEIQKGIATGYKLDYAKNNGRERYFHGIFLKVQF